MSSPVTRDDIEIAIVCTLVHEYDAARLAFDKIHDVSLGRAIGDHNMYKTGEIGGLNAVLLRIPNKGKGVAAGTAASLRSSFPNLKLALLTGICGGVPDANAAAGEDLLLGDVVVSTTVVQYDLGRHEQTGFNMIEEVEDSLGRPVRYIRTFVAELEGGEEREKIEEKAAYHLTKIQEKQAKMKRSPEKFNYPGPDSDRLFQPHYRHKHRDQSCVGCSEKTDAICDNSWRYTCTQLHCDEKELVDRPRLSKKKAFMDDNNISDAQAPYIFVGKIGSGDTVVKSGEYRDMVASRHDLLAFEMEGAGIFDEIPCIVIKGVCDYADSHKNQNWQHFGSAAAAAVAKALLADLYPKTPKTESSAQSATENKQSTQAATENKQSTQAPVEVAAEQARGQVGSPPASQTNFYGGVHGTHVVAGQTISGGTHEYNFGSK